MNIGHIAIFMTSLSVYILLLESQRRLVRSIMSNRFAAYEYLHKHAMNGPWAERVICELGYLLEISSVNALCYDEQILIQLENQITQLDCGMPFSVHQIA